MTPSTDSPPSTFTAPSPLAAEAVGTERELRADRILDAAEELLVAWGRRKITIEDVARRAKVGKGTVYLHFATKEALLLTVVMRAQLGLMRQVLDFVGRSPDNVRPSEVARSLYLSHLDSPLMRAVFTGGTESLGHLSRDASTLVGETVQERRRAMAAYWDVLRDLGLLRSDLPVDNQLYAYNALVLGHLVTPPVLEEQGLHVPGHGERADLMAQSIRLLLEQDAAPENTRKAQTRALEVFSDLDRTMRSEIERLKQTPRTT
ncbi:TetR/AcrR family transcriptional regulator [Nocardiopsis sp. NPDC058631]|uniref:TetR/AcrR family transcriptional regulator n=1 Tax=Nocardiopsis sp. NPDC058631 TaxID=3346566 RepID=UPI00364D72EC